MIVKIINFEKTYKLRHSVLWPHKSIENCFIDIDQNGVHFGCYFKDELISIGSFFRMKNEDFPFHLIQFRLRAMATNLLHKGLGAGTTLINFASKFLKQNCSADIIWCDARELAVNFYKKNDFEILKGPYDIPIIGKHYLMSKNL